MPRHQQALGRRRHSLTGAPRARAADPHTGTYPAGFPRARDAVLASLRRASYAALGTLTPLWSRIPKVLIPSSCVMYLNLGGPSMRDLYECSAAIAAAQRNLKKAYYGWQSPHPITTRTTRPPRTVQGGVQPRTRSCRTRSSAAHDVGSRLRAELQGAAVLERRGNLLGVRDLFGDFSRRTSAAGGSSRGRPAARSRLTFAERWGVARTECHARRGVRTCNGKRREARFEIPRLPAVQGNGSVQRRLLHGAYDCRTAARRQQVRIRARTAAARHLPRDVDAQRERPRLRRRRQTLRLAGKRRRPAGPWPLYVVRKCSARALQARGEDVLTRSRSAS